MEKSEVEVEEPPAKGIHRLKQLWPEMSLFERFEYLVMLFVSFMLAIIILVALVRLVENVYLLLLEQMTDHTGFKAFQATFGMLLTLLIAFEFRNSINAVLEGKGLLIQVKIVVLIAIIALARKFLVMDPKEYDAMIMLAYAAIALSLGIIYWLLSKRESEDKDLLCRI
ncbi:MAG: phosphate-starvation-inducible PsiE family protein [Candidatus Thiodiazotropha sp. LLP2]|nr:phosphate-starvation-inducible PsiE family protein [Candidatus Thiodiazotropha lotti]MCG8011135.1 phosphate-starvation-inducible PsiE family protein [Candidatus Thiodiazotropha lotti]MCW4210598.1 phosphate-starvation-inducible PsiE family protein [Candidatus Thiodiazotropha lotti]MCW4216808.1 phosphate-starvation-inducible PsiE family protein [Candidatus Thiodiazotropha lotti]